MARLVEQLTEAKIRNISAPGLYADGRGMWRKNGADIVELTPGQNWETERPKQRKA